MTLEDFYYTHLKLNKDKARERWRNCVHYPWLGWFGEEEKRWLKYEETIEKLREYRRDKNIMGNR